MHSMSVMEQVTDKQVQIQNMHNAKHINKLTVVMVYISWWRCHTRKRGASQHNPGSEIYLTKHISIKL